MDLFILRRLVINTCPKNIKQRGRHATVRAYKT
jgi:hypothetical protein